MAKVNPDEHSKRRAKLTLDDFDGGDATALTIMAAEEMEIENDDGTKRKSMAMTFDETGDKAFWPNVTSLRIIVDVYGDDTDDWIGEPLALSRHEGTFRGKAYENIQVAPLALWATILKGSDFKVTPQHVAAAKKAAAVAEPVVKPVAKLGKRGR